MRHYRIKPSYQVARAAGKPRNLNSWTLADVDHHIAKHTRISKAYAKLLVSSTQFDQLAWGTRRKISKALAPIRQHARSV